MEKSSDFSGQELSTLRSMRPSVSGTPEERFTQNCIDYFHAWLDERPVGTVVPTEQVMVLLYAESPDVEATSLIYSSGIRKRIFMKNYALSNGLTICNENLRVMLQVVPKFLDADDALEFVSDNLKKSQVFALLFLGQQRVCIHNAGVDIEEWCYEPPPSIRLNRASPGNITPKMVEEQLEEFHTDATAKPGGFAARLMWKTDEPKVRLHTQPELRVQSSLLPFLRGTFRYAGAVVDEEVRNSGGRVDIKIERSDPLKPSKMTSTMLELKVLSPDNSDNANEAWALKGIDQAVRYRSRNTDASFACIYDAREVKDYQMPGLDTQAASVKVVLMRFPMDLPSPKAPRKKKTPSPGKGAPTTGAAKKRVRPAAKAEQKPGKPSPQRAGKRGSKSP